MTRLEKLLNTLEPVRYPEDVSILKSEIPELASLSDVTVQTLYSDWSEDWYAAGWIYLSSGLDEFRGWLRQEVK